MFDMRLGLALGKSLREVRALPYPEYRQWQAYFIVEPFGFQDREYRTAVLLAQMRNVQVSKKKDAVSVLELVRDMPKLVMEYFQKERSEVQQSIKFEAMTPEEKKDFIRKQVASMFGKPVIRK